MALVLGVIHQHGNAFGVSFPDYPGVAVGGASINEALERSRDALAAHFAAMIEEGIDIPEPQRFVTFDKDEGLVGAHYVDVEVPRKAFLARAARERLAG
jgi:predicted RNase H-like HicB family nuclease